ncbi:hypothetical protein HID58_080933 [Brassica napus]|uniref:BnaC08g14090D protein n=3 Tax=Brassica napus TaxID=3708 RepID=A0A078G5L7_BRANA|nr:UPF0725 protein At1g02770-like isoform X1 [Brassica napus]KAH0863722.1 hypothetical protein HID58_080933 [Brassica napus]CAF2108055.1 unnamed protein product [Brassica napus]CDY20649.1 BnaC08g14090D [Brassica napus]
MKTNQPGEKNPEEVMSNSAPGGSTKRKGGGRKRNPDERTVADLEYRAPGRSYRRLEKKRMARRKAQREETARKEEETLGKAEEAFWRKVDETDGFDIEIEGAPCYFGGMSVYKGGVDCPLVVKLYATVGLHRYNMLEGTNLHLHEIEKYVVVCTIMPVSYYITLIAEDPATSSFVTFQTHVDQRSLGQIDFTCYISRPKGTKSEIYPTQFFDAKDLPDKWPSKEAFADQSRFLYKMQKSDWEEHDWIRLYMEFSFFNRHRCLNHNMSDLKILDVVVETEENVPHETVLKSLRNVLVYIRYDQDLGADGVSKHIAIVRRTVEPTTHCVCLLGESQLVPDSE